MRELGGANGDDNGFLSGSGTWVEQMEQGRSRGEHRVYLRPGSERLGQMEADVRCPRVEHALTPIGSGESEFFRFELHQGD